MTALRFPAEAAVGEVDWEDAREPGGWGHLLAIGVVEVINKQHNARFTERDTELAAALASLAAVAIDNANLYAQLADAVVTARMSYRL